MTMTGADAAALDQMAGRLTAAADQVDRITSALQRQLRAPWQGADAIEFRSDWSRSHLPALGRVAGFMRDGATTLRANAAEQRRASADQPSLLLASCAPLSLQPQGSWLDRVMDAAYGGLTGPTALFTHVWHTLKYGDDVVETFRHLRWDAGLDPGPKLLGPLGKWMTAAEVVLDTKDAVQGIANGDWDKAIRNGIDLGWDVATMHPYVALGKLAWDGGWEIGKFAAPLFDNSDQLIDKVVREQYGGELTPATAHQLATRYDGVSGFFRWVGDGL